MLQTANKRVTHNRLALTEVALLRVALSKVALLRVTQSKMAFHRVMLVMVLVVGGLVGGVRGFACSEQEHRSMQAGSRAGYFHKIVLLLYVF